MTTFDSRERVAESSCQAYIAELGVDIDPSSELLVHYLDVEDRPSSQDPEMRGYIQGVIEGWNAELQSNPEWQGPFLDTETGGYTPRNPVSDELFSSPALLEWAKSMKTAKALYPLQRPHSDRLPGDTTQDGELLQGAIIDENARLFLLHGLDSIGIRSRASIMSMLAHKHFRPNESNSWTSLACGAAVPVLDSVRSLKDNSGIHLQLIDIDNGALQFADRLAKNEGLEPSEYSIKQRNLIRELIIRDSLVQELGEGSAQIVDMMGIFEYFDEKNAATMLRNAYRLVDEGGALIAANMLSSRPQLDFNVRGVGWPDIYPRSLKEIADIISMADIPQENVDIYIPSDGLYAVMEIRK